MHALLRLGVVAALVCIGTPSRGADPVETETETDADADADVDEHPGCSPSKGNCPCCNGAFNECTETDVRGQAWRTRLHPNIDAMPVMLAGISMLVVSYAVSTGYLLANSSGNDRVLDAVPIAGAVNGAIQHSSGSAATPGLLFAAWTQVAGVLLMAVAGREPLYHYERQRLTVVPTAQPGKVGLSLSADF
jgi:hypothetical protein